MLGKKWHAVCHASATLAFRHPGQIWIKRRLRWGRGGRLAVLKFWIWFETKDPLAALLIVSPGLGADSFYTRESKLRINVRENYASCVRTLGLKGTQRFPFWPVEVFYVITEVNKFYSVTPVWKVYPHFNILVLKRFQRPTNKCLLYQLGDR